MRKGQLIKKDVSTLKAGDSAFCTYAKHFFVVKEMIHFSFFVLYVVKEISPPDLEIVL